MWLALGRARAVAPVGKEGHFSPNGKHLPCSTVESRRQPPGRRCRKAGCCCGEWSWGSHQQHPPSRLPTAQQAWGPAGTSAGLGSYGENLARKHVKGRAGGQQPGQPEEGGSAQPAPSSGGRGASHGAAPTPCIVPAPRGPGGGAEHLEREADWLPPSSQWREAANRSPRPEPRCPPTQEPAPGAGASLSRRRELCALGAGSLRASPWASLVLCD